MSSNVTTSTISILKRVYPVDSIYISVNSTNPATSLGFGTWSAFGAGRVPVGYDSGQTEFDTDEETGGAKTHTLAESEIPSHTHTGDATTLYRNGASETSGRVSGDNTAGTGVSTIGTYTPSVQATGGGGAHNNLQPYIVVRMWKRTA